MGEPFGRIGPTFEMPIFDGSRWATVRLQNVRAQEAALDYERTVLSALHEVENALAAYKADRDRGVSLASAVEESRDALSLARERYSSGVANFIDVLDAERSLQQNELRGHEHHRHLDGPGSDLSRAGWWLGRLGLIHVPCSRSGSRPYPASGRNSA